MTMTLKQSWVTCAGCWRAAFVTLLLCGLTGDFGFMLIFTNNAGGPSGFHGARCKAVHARCLSTAAVPVRD